jgi:hypothetical protein
MSTLIRCTDLQAGTLRTGDRGPSGDTQPFQILVQEGQTVPDSTAVVQSISDVVSSADGDFALLTTDMGRSVVQLTANAQIVPILGVGASDEQGGLDPRDYVVGGGAIVAVSQSGADMEIFASDIDDPDDSTSILSTGDTFGGGTVTEVFSLNPVYVNAANTGTARIEIDDSPDIIISYDTTSGVPQAVLTDNDPAPGFPAGIGARVNGTARINLAGFVGIPAVIFGIGIGNGNNDVRYILDSDGQVAAMIQEGTQVPGALGGTVFNFPSELILGSTGAAFLSIQGPPGSTVNTAPRAVGFVDLAGNYRTIALGDTVAPGGGIFDDFIGPSIAMNDAGRMVFRATLQDGGSAYYTIEPTDPQATPERLIGSGDVVPLPGGGSATVTSVGSFAATGGQSGDATPLNDSQLTLTAGLDTGQSAVVVVDLPE